MIFIISFPVDLSFMRRLKNVNGEFLMNNFHLDKGLLCLISHSFEILVGNQFELFICSFVLEWFLRFSRYAKP